MAKAQNDGPWADRPSDDETGIKYRVWRVQPKKTHIVHILSDELVAAYLHYSGKRSVPCGGPSCGYCDAGAPRRWQGYIVTRYPDGSETGILEITAHAAPRLYEYYDTHKTLRGAQLIAKRTNELKNGPVNIKVTPAAIDVALLPPAPDLKAILLRMWSWGDPAQPDAAPEDQPKPKDGGRGAIPISEAIDAATRKRGPKQA